MGETAAPHTIADGDWSGAATGEVKKTFVGDVTARGETEVGANETAHALKAKQAAPNKAARQTVRKANAGNPNKPKCGGAKQAECIVRKVFRCCNVCPQTPNPTYFLVQTKSATIRKDKQTQGFYDYNRGNCVICWSFFGYSVLRCKRVNPISRTGRHAQNKIDGVLPSIECLSHKLYRLA